MAVNLKATATLNIKPFMASLESLAAANARLNKSTVKGGKNAATGTLAQVAATERLAKAERIASEEITRAGSNSNKILRQGTADAKAYGSALTGVYAEHGRLIDSVRKMTSAQQAAMTATRNYNKAAAAQADAEATGLQGPAYDRLAAQTLAASERLASAQRRVAAENQKIAAAADKAENSQRRANAATTAGANGARSYANSLTGLSQEKLKLQAASERLSAAEGRLASAMARSNGMVTPAVASARAGVLSATGAYNSLAQAQAAVGKAGPAAASGLAAQRYLFTDLSRQATMTSVALLALPAATLGIAASWEKAFANVVRTADPTFAEMDNKVSALRKSLVGMVQTMPIGFGDVTEIATLANQMGVATSEVASFTQAVAMFGATSGVNVDIAATAFGRLKSILGQASIPYMEMSDAILKVGVNSVATEAEIINITTQISSIAASAGFSGKEMIALSGALASVRVPPELSRGVVTRIFGQIDKAVAAGGSGLTNLARISGTTVDQFKEQWGSDQAAGLFNNFLKGLRNAGTGARAELEALGITSVRDIPVTLRLANAADSRGREGELFTQTLRDAENAAGETQRQYTIMSETVVAKLKMLGNNLMAFFDAAGSGSLGAFGKLIDGLSTGIRNFTRDIDKPMAIIGEAFGVTNGDALGFLGSVMLIGGALTAAAAAALKFVAIWKTVAHAKAVTNIGGIITNLTGSLTSAIPSIGLFGSKVGTASTGMAGAAGAATKLGGAAGGLSGLFGPIGIAIAIATTALFAWNNAAQKNVTTTAQLAESLAKINPGNMAELDTALASITVAGPKDFGGWELNSRPFAGGVSDLKNSVAELTQLQKDNSYDWFGGKQVSEPLQWLDRTVSGAWDDLAGLEEFDKSIQSLVDSGNSAKAIQLIRGLKMSGQELNDTMNLSSGANMKSFLQGAFDAAGIEMTSSNLDKLARNELPLVTDALYGVAGATKVVDELFSDDMEGVGKFVNKLDEAAASFISFGDAVSAGTKTDEDGNFASFSLTDFSGALRQQIADQEKWVSDITEISKHGSTAVVEALADLGPEGRRAATELAAGLRAGTPEAIEALQALEDSAVAQAAGIGSAIAETMANQAWASKALGSADLAKVLSASLGDDKMSALYDAAKGVGAKTVEQILQGLSRGDISFEDALRQLSGAQAPIIPVEMVPEVKEAALSAVGTRLKALSKIPVAMDVNTTTTVAELRQVFQDPSLNKLDIDANLTLTEAYEQSRAFQVWAQEQGIDMFLGADDTPAKLTVAALDAYARGQVLQVQIDALPTLAEGEVWDVVQLANGLTAFVQVDANGKPAEGKLAQVVDKTGKTVGTIQITADDAKAYAVANRWNGKTMATSYIDVITRDVGGSRVAQGSGGGGGITRADGGIMEYYAKGGIREDHRPQIAPAGAMRIWAEPETGGEAYIPFAMDRRKRAEGILGTVASRFGYGLVPSNNVSQYANGGTYELQSRSRYGRMRNDIQGSDQPKREINITIQNPIEKNWAQDAWEKIQEIGGAFDV